MQPGEGTQIWGVGTETCPYLPNMHVLEDLLFVGCLFLQRRVFKAKGQDVVVSGVGPLGSGPSLTRTSLWDPGQGTLWTSVFSPVDQGNQICVCPGPFRVCD